MSGYLFPLDLLVRMSFINCVSIDTNIITLRKMLMLTADDKPVAQGTVLAVGPNGDISNQDIISVFNAATQPTFGNIFDIIRDLSNQLLSGPVQQGTLDAVVQELNAKIIDASAAYTGPLYAVIEDVSGLRIAMADISASTAVLAANTASFATTIGDLSASVTALAATVTDLSSNTAAIRNTVTDVSASLTVLAATVTDLSANTAAISTTLTDLSANTAANTATISNTVTDVSASLTVLAATVTDLSANTAANTAAIRTTLTDLSANTAAISATLTDLSTNTASQFASLREDVDLTNDIVFGKSATVKGQLIIDISGTPDIPAITFTNPSENTTATGIYHPADGTLSLTVNGANTANFTTTYTELNTDVYISTDASAVAPHLQLIGKNTGTTGINEHVFRDAVLSSNDNIHTRSYFGKSSTNVKREFAREIITCRDALNAAEDAVVATSLMRGGTLTQYERIDALRNNISIGRDAGVNIDLNGGFDIIAIGSLAGSNSLGQTVAIGAEAGQTNQQQNSVAIGRRCGNSTQGTQSVALGYFAAESDQGFSAVAIGDNAARTGQKNYGIAIGAYSGQNTQGNSAVAFGIDAGKDIQSDNAVAIGAGAGRTTQGLRSIAVGSNAGQTNMGRYSIAIGDKSNMINAGQDSIMIGGYSVDISGSGNKSIAIGQDAVANDSSANSITLNASGAPITANQAGLFVAPIRNTTVSSRVLMYNPLNSEVNTFSTMYYYRYTLDNAQLIYDGIYSGMNGWPWGTPVTNIIGERGTTNDLIQNHTSTLAIQHANGNDSFAPPGTSYPSSIWKCPISGLWQIQLNMTYDPVLNGRPDSIAIGNLTKRIMYGINLSTNTVYIDQNDDIIITGHLNTSINIRAFSKLQFLLIMPLSFNIQIPTFIEIYTSPSIP